MTAIDKLKQEELARAEKLKARAETCAAERAAIEQEMADNPPETAVGERAFAEVRRALIGRSGGAAERIRARVEARQAG